MEKTQMKIHLRLLLVFFVSVSPLLSSAQTVHPTSDGQKQKQWQSMETGKWDFAPDWYYYLLHKDYSGAETYWHWSGFESGLKVRFKQNKSNIKQIGTVRVSSLGMQYLKLEESRKQEAKIKELYNEELIKQTDRIVDIAYLQYKDSFEELQNCIIANLNYCIDKSNGKMNAIIQELTERNKIICDNVNYIHKTGINEQLENAKRQLAYEQCKSDMEDLLQRCVKIARLANVHY